MDIYKMPRWIKCSAGHCKRHPTQLSLCEDLFILFLYCCLFCCIYRNHCIIDGYLLLKRQYLWFYKKTNKDFLFFKGNAVFTSTCPILNYYSNNVLPRRCMCYVESAGHHFWTESLLLSLSNVCLRFVLQTKFHLVPRGQRRKCNIMRR